MGYEKMNAFVRFLLRNKKDGKLMRSAMKEDDDKGIVTMMIRMTMMKE